MNEFLIKDLSVGEDIQGFFIIKSVNVKTSSNNKLYLDMNLTDKSGEINAKIWDINTHMPEEFSAGTVVKVKGTVTSWQNNLQLKIIRIRVAVESDDVNYESLVKAAPLKPSVMYSYVKGIVSDMKNDDIKKLVMYFLESEEDRFLVHPAAKTHHHSIRSGLLYHIYRMLKTAVALSDIYTNINPDLLYAGIILHDFEKLNEMDANDLGVVSDYTRDGQLFGHIIMGIKRIDEVSKKLEISQEVSDLLQHMVLTHHYEPEFGSPKKPMIPEAELLHYIDMIDARMYDMDKVLSDIEKGEFSEPVFVLDRRKLYRSKL